MKIHLVRSTIGCNWCQPLMVDPYWRECAEGQRWHDVARGDGHSYSPTEHVVEQAPGETPEALCERAQQLADELRRRDPSNRCQCD